MTNVIYQPTDLAGSRRVEFLAAAKQGLARLRDKDGESLVMLPERQLQLLEALRTWTFFRLRLDALIAADKLPRVQELGDLAWLTHADGLGLAVFLGVVPTALAYLSFAHGLKRLTAAETATLTLAEPLTAAILGAVVLAEHLTAPALAGAGLVLSALVALAIRPPTRMSCAACR